LKGEAATDYADDLVSRLSENRTTDVTLLEGRKQPAEEKAFQGSRLRQELSEFSSRCAGADRLLSGNDREGF
jgi:hypothetical protein